MKKQLLLLTAGMIAMGILIWMTDFNEVLGILTEMKLSVLLAICSIQIFKYVLVSIQWMMIIQASGHRITMLSMMHILMSGKFIESVTPGFKTGGEITKTVMLKDSTDMSLEEAIAITATQKIFSILAFLVLSGASVLSVTSSLSLLDASLKNSLIGGLLGLAAISSLLVAVLVKPQCLKRILPKKVKSAVDKCADLMGMMLERPLILIGQFIVAFGVWGTYALTAVVVAQNLGISLQALYLSAATYISYMLGMIPLLPGGMGTTEAGMIGSLGLFGLTATKAVSMTMIMRVVTFWFLLPFSALWVFISRIAVGLGWNSKLRTEFVK